MSRSVFLLGVGIAVAALAFALTDWIVGPTAGVTETNVRRIRAGMALPEVEALLGTPGVDCPYTLCHDARPGPLRMEERHRYIWRCAAGGAARVEMDANRKVLWAEWEPPGEPPPTLLSRLRSWLGL